MLEGRLGLGEMIKRIGDGYERKRRASFALGSCTFVLSCGVEAMVRGWVKGIW